MIRINHTVLVIFSALIWFVVGCSLLSLGSKLLVHAELTAPLLGWLTPIAGGKDQGVVMLLAVALLLGFLKGKFVLRKSAYQIVMRIRSLENPAPLAQVYSKKYLILLASMVGLGMGIKFFGLPDDIRGFIDVAIGSALINGSVQYFTAPKTCDT